MQTLVYRLFGDRLQDLGLRLRHPEFVLLHMQWSVYALHNLAVYNVLRQWCDLLVSYLSA